MNVEYCSNCGHKMEYGMHKPNFCPQCGTQVGGGSISPRQVDVSHGQVNEVVETFDEPQAAPSLSKLRAGLSYEVDYGEVGYKQTSLNDLVREKPSDRKRRRPEKLKGSSTKKETVEPINAEASLQAKLDVVKDSLADCASSASKFKDAEEEEDNV